jgi:hypothetical protein
MAATAKHAGKMMRAKLFIEVLPVCLARCHQHTVAAIIPAS